MTKNWANDMGAGPNGRPINVLFLTVRSFLYVSICWLYLGQANASGTCPEIPASMDNMVEYEGVFDDWRKLARDPYAKSRSEITRKCLAEAGIADTLPEMIDWLETPAKAGLIEAQIQLGYFYAWMSRWLRPYDETLLEKSEYWLGIAYDNGSQEAGVILATHYALSVFPEPEPGYGLRLLRKLADLGNTEAQLFLKELQSDK